MAYTQRKQDILNLLLSSERTLSIAELSSKLYASRSTIRRDLIQMEQEGLIVRHFGAVSLLSSTSSENTVKYRMLENRDRKKRIARICAPILKDHMVLFLDSSSTVSYLVPILCQHSDMTVITNGISIALQLSSAPDVRCFLCPGLLKTGSYSIIGDYSSQFLDNFRADIAFISCKAIQPGGLFEGDDAQALIKQHMIRNARRTVALVDATKVYQDGFFLLSDFSSITDLISVSVKSCAC